VSKQPQRGPYAPGKRENFPIRKTVTLTEEQAVKLARLANQHRTTASAVIRQLLENA